MTSSSSTPPTAAERLQALLDQSTLGVYELGSDLRFSHVSRRCAELLGRTPQELLAVPSVLHVVAPTDRPRVRGILLARLSGRSGPQRYAFRACLPDGSEVPVEVQERAFEHEGRTFVTGLMLDVTDRSDLEGQLRRSQRMEAVGELTGAVAHDFNNLLTAMLTPVELVITELGEEHRLASPLVHVRQTVLRAAGLTRQLLSYSRERVHRAEVVRPGDLLEEMRPLLEGVLGDEVRLEASCEPLVPHVRVDPAHMEQVVVNLLVNARDAMGGSGRVRLRVERARLSTAGEGAAIVVEDEGSGVPEELRRRVFDPFFTTKEEGTGLGLSTVAAIVRESGGEIRVEECPGGGARFVAVLPGAQGPVTRARTDPAHVRRPEVPRRARILLVDDEPSVRRVVEAALTRFGHQVVAAAGHNEALAVARDEGSRFDLILCDVGLPAQSGFDVVRALLPLCPRASVVFTTGSAADAAIDPDRRAEMPAGVWLHKPFSIDELLDAVRRALAGGRAPRRRAREGR